MDKYSIGQISKLTGIPTKTIRFYEEEGIINRAKRGDNGYRLYGKEAVEELKLMKYAKDMGLPLGEVKKLIKGCDNGQCEHSKEYIEKNIGDYLKLLNEKISQMDQLRSRLNEFKKALDSNKGSCSTGPYCCNLFHQLVNYKNNKEVR